LLDSLLQEITSENWYKLLGQRGASAQFHGSVVGVELFWRSQERQNDGNVFNSTSVQEDGISPTLPHMF